MFEATPHQPPHQNTVGHQWRQACTRAGITGVTLLDLRHFYASGLIAAGCDVVTVQRALGHAKATTTLNTYAHLWPTVPGAPRATCWPTCSRILRTVCGPTRGLRLLSCRFAPLYTLKRNSTTSPSCMT